MFSLLILAIALGSVCGLLFILGIILVLRHWYRARNGKPSQYEKIVPDQILHGSLVESQTIITPTVSLKTIPFTVPPGVGKSHGRGLDEKDGGSATDLTSLVSTSRRGSDESTGEVRGSYTLGHIDPSLYRMMDEDDNIEYPENHIGRIWFAVEYERESEKLLVNLIKVKNLPSRSSGSTNGCDPFVRIYLMPDERRYLQSKYKKKTCNPKYDESFVFQVSQKALNERVLRLTLYDLDRHRRHNVIGHAMYPLREHDYESNERVVIWRDLERDVQEVRRVTSDHGEVHLALSYNNNLERLTVGVFEGKEFKKVESTETADYYIKVSLLIQNKVVKTKRSSTMKKTSNPVFNESFTFRLSMSSLDTASITVTAMQANTGIKDKIVGRVVLGSFMYARGKELDHWNEMVANQKDQVCQWHVLT